MLKEKAFENTRKIILKNLLEVISKMLMNTYFNSKASPVLMSFSQKQNQTSSQQGNDNMIG